MKNKNGHICDNLKNACQYLTAEDKIEISKATGKSIEMVRAVIRQTRYNKEIESLLIKKALKRSREAVEINANLLTNQMTEDDYINHCREEGKIK
jgi:hypothetical protein